MMKTDIHKIKTEQAWNRLYDRLDKDHLLVEDHRMPKIPMWVRYGTVAAMVVGLVFSTLYWGFGQKEELPDFITQENQDVPTLVTTLEDGSVVFLAKETSIRYPEHFVSDKREVSLQGATYLTTMPLLKNHLRITKKDCKELNRIWMMTDGAMYATFQPYFQLPKGHSLEKSILQAAHKMTEDDATYGYLVQSYKFKSVRSENSCN